MGDGGVFGVDREAFLTTRGFSISSGHTRVI